MSDMSDKLPENVVNITAIRIERGMQKICDCDKRKFIVDSRNRLVNCASCGAYVDPYDAVLEIATYPERLKADVESLLEQRKMISQYKPYLVVIKNLEQHARDKNMMPVCPKCSTPFDLHELNNWINRKYVIKKDGEVKC